MSQLSFAQAESKQFLDTKIQEVTVFITGGEIIRTTKVNLKKGRNVLTFKGISSVADQKSIQFLADKNLSIVSVSTEFDYLNLHDQKS